MTKKFIGIDPSTVAGLNIRQFKKFVEKRENAQNELIEANKPTRKPLDKTPNYKKDSDLELKIDLNPEDLAVFEEIKAKKRNNQK